MLGDVYMKTLPVGLQLFTVRDEMAKDLPAALKAVKEAGYDYVETAGFFGLSGEEFKAELDKAGLVAVSAHVPLADMLKNPEEAIETHKKLGCKYFVVPYLGGGERYGDPNFNSILKGIEKFGEMCHENGLWLLYHNHDFEFEKTADGRYVLDYMYETIKPECLGAEPDTCWVNIGGEDPASYIRKYSGRCPVVHLKDFVGGKTENMYTLIGTDEAKQEKSDAFAFRPLGQGVQNFPEIIAASIEAGAEYLVVEQDDTNDIPCIEAAKMSRDYLKTLGF